MKSGFLVFLCFFTYQYMVVSGCPVCCYMTFKGLSDLRNHNGGGVSFHHKSVSKLPSPHKTDIAQLVQVGFNFWWSFESGFGSQLSKYRYLWCFLDNKWSFVGGRPRSCCFLLILNFNEDIWEAGQKWIKVQWQIDVTPLCTKLIYDIL